MQLRIADLTGRYLHLRSAMNPSLARLALFFLAFIGMSWYGLSNINLTFRGDSYEIWEVAKNYYDSNRARSFVEYRGGFVFVFYNGLYNISSFLGINDVIFFRVWSAFVFSCMGFIFPIVIGKIFNQSVSAFKIFIFTALMFWFFCGYFLYPQTDIPALFFLLLAIFISLKILNRKYWLILVGGIVIGGLLASSIMMRSSYALAAPLVWIFLLRELRVRGSAWWRVVCVVFLSILICTALTRLNVSSATISSKSVVELQLMGGITLQKVEWNAGDSTYPGMLKLTDRRGEAILKAEGITNFGGKITVAEYFLLFVKYPADMLILQMKHLFGGLDITYNSVYVQDMRAPRILRSLVNYTCIFLALLVIRARFDENGWRWHNLPLLLAIFSQSFVAIPFMGEVRFFMPVILAFMVIAVLNFEKSFLEIRNKKLGMHWFFFVALCFMYSASQFETAPTVLLLTTP